MGTRIHKAMGYGVRLRKNDPRLSEQFRTGGLSVKCRSTDAKQFVGWAKKNTALMSEAICREYPVGRHSPADILARSWGPKDHLQPSRAVVCPSDENEDSKALLFVPPSAPDWFRYDDSIDYYESGSGMKFSAVTHRTMLTGLFPWQGTVIRIRPPKRRADAPGVVIPKGELSPLRLDGGDWNRLVGAWDPKLPPTAEGAALMHYKQDWRPKVPVEVIALVYWSGATAKPMALIDDLRPMIVTWWE